MEDVGGCDTEVKYIDPTYMIRAIKPNANDSPLGGIVFRNWMLLGGVWRGKLM